MEERRGTALKGRYLTRIQRTRFSKKNVSMYRESSVGARLGCQVSAKIFINDVLYIL